MKEQTKIFNFIWEKLDGRKFISGLVISLIGLFMYFFPETRGEAKPVMVAGFGLMTVGGIHKAVKRKK